MKLRYRLRLWWIRIKAWWDEIINGPDDIYPAF